VKIFKCRSRLSRRSFTLRQFASGRPESFFFTRSLTQFVFRGYSWAVVHDCAIKGLLPPCVLCLFPSVNYATFFATDAPLFGIRMNTLPWSWRKCPWRYLPPPRMSCSASVRASRASWVCHLPTCARGPSHPCNRLR
jgi:hypothetical protein